MSTVKITESVFGVTKNNNEVKKYTLSTPDGFEVSLISLGATIQSIRQADKNNQISEITLGYDTLQEYENDKHCLGCTVGRVTNRIKNARFELDGTVYELPKCDSTKKHYLHGEFNRRVWDSSIENNDTVVFKYQSPDGENGFPGQVDATVKYTLSSDNRLTLDFRATTTKPTPINLTNHVYFNLSGNLSQPIVDHKLLVHAENIIPTDEEHIPTGEISSVENTPFDFRTFARIGDHVDEFLDGYDIMFIVDGEGNRPFGKVVDENSGRAISFESTQKGVQFYTGYHLDGTPGFGGAAFNRYSGLCLETQNFSDSVNNQPKFPSTILHPGEEYHERTTYHFHLA